MSDADWMAYSEKLEVRQLRRLEVVVAWRQHNHCPVL